MLRLDRVADALAAGTPLVAGSATLRLVKPEWARFHFPGETKARSRTRDETPDPEPPTVSSAARGPGRIRSMSPITTPNGACRNSTTARSTRS